MSRSSSPNLMDTLRKFKPSHKPKLTHIPISSSSSEGGSPVRRSHPAIMIISDSESERENEPILCLDSDADDCVIVTTESASNKCSPSKSDESSAKEKDKDPLISLPEFRENQRNVGNNSDDDKLRPMKRKRIKSSIDKNEKRKKRRKKIDSDSDADVDEQSLQKECVYDSDEDDVNLGINTSLRKQVLDLLQNGSEKDLNAVSNMNAKKLDLILANRPYNDWITTVQKFNDTKGLTCSMLNTVCDTIVARDIVIDLMTKCEKLAAKTERTISSSGTLVAKPSALLNPEMKLHDHQLLGLNWLALMRSRTLNSILADEMGLGKTIQVIAFLAYLKENELVLPGYPHLVVVPSSTLNNWYEEFSKWCPSFKVCIYHGNQAERRYLRHCWFKDGFGDADVVLTTYSCATSSREEKKMFRVKEFNYVIFDEAHMLKNMNTQRYEALIQFNGNFKILLTGTPLQNNLLELMSLLIFLMPDLFKSKQKHIQLLFSKCTKPIDEQSSEFEKEKLNQAKRIIEPFMLRRLKESVLPNLPTKTVSVEKCPLPEDQREKYNEVLSHFKEVCLTEETTNYMGFFMRLRKIANHPLLLRYYFTEDMLQKIAERLARDTHFKGTNPEYIQDDLYFKSDFELFDMCQDFDSLRPLHYSLPDEAFCNSGKLKVLTPLLESLKQDGHRVLIFSQFILMLDILQEYCKIKKFTYVRLDGSTPTPIRQELIDLYNMDDEIFIFLLSTKAGGLGINLTAADTVIIHDVDFNPYNDKQAEDRCHRVGQKRPVKVIKFVSEDTVEEGIHSTAEQKLHLEKEITAVNDEEKANATTVLQLLKQTLGLIDS